MQGQATPQPACQQLDPRPYLPASHRRQIHHPGASCPDRPAPCGFEALASPGANPQLLVGAMTGGPMGCEAQWTPCTDGDPARFDNTFIDLRGDYQGNEARCLGGGWRLLLLAWHAGKALPPCAGPSPGSSAPAALRPCAPPHTLSTCPVAGRHRVQLGPGRRAGRPAGPSVNVPSQDGARALRGRTRAAPPTSSPACTPASALPALLSLPCPCHVPALPTTTIHCPSIRRQCSPAACDPGLSSWPRWPGLAFARPYISSMVYCRGVSQGRLALPLLPLTPTLLLAARFRRRQRGRHSAASTPLHTCIAACLLPL